MKTTVPDMNKETEIAWAAGFIEGEGSFSSVTRHAGRYIYLRVQVAQVDREPLERLVKMFGGTISNRRRAHLKMKDGYPRQDQFQWEVVGQRAEDCTNLIYEYLSARRKSQVGKAKASVPDRLART